MSRVKTVLIIVLATTFGVAAAVLAQRDFSKVEIKTEKLADGVYMLTGSGGNIGVSAGPDGVLLIDDQFAELSEKIKAAVASVSDKPIRFVFNTHWHGDHVGGNEALANAGATIVAHDNVRKRMSVEQYIASMDRKVPPSPEKALPVVTYDDSVTFHLNGDDIVCFHVPNAHTDGDAIVQFRKANVVHMGDCLFTIGYPRIDASSGGSINGMIAACDRMLGIVGPNTKIIPGHGDLTDKAGMQEYRDMLAKIRDRVAKAIKAKKTLEQVQASKPTADLDEKWGKGFIKPEQIVEVVYQDLSRGTGKK